MIKKFFALLLAFFCFSNNADAKEDPLIIYVALSEVSMGGTTGTSEQLNHLILHYGGNVGSLKNSLGKGYPPSFDPNREIHVYNRENIRFAYNNCEYISDSLGCGVKNEHWTLRTFVHVGDKYSIITTKLYDEKGREISRGTQTAWGTIRMIPQWKLTVIKEKGGFAGNKETEIFEQYPPKIEELPPLIRPRHIWQSTILMYSSTRVKR
tara:strand:+ start:313 stop:939 length:627 start_codon:yes stop_codon:yes gene_type:complete